jgi:hypothetical protein
VMGVKSGDSVYCAMCYTVQCTREFTKLALLAGYWAGSIRNVLDWLVPDPTFSHLQLYSFVVYKLLSFIVKGGQKKISRFLTLLQPYNVTLSLLRPSMCCIFVEYNFLI